jgi:hypothetical protein
MTPSIESWVEQARAVPMAHVLAMRNIKLTGRGGKLTGPCPLCGGEDRFAVDLGKPAFNCRGSDQGGRLPEIGGLPAGLRAELQERIGMAAGSVPERYFDAWARLQVQKPASVPIDVRDTNVQSNVRLP